MRYRSPHSILKEGQNPDPFRGDETTFLLTSAAHPFQASYDHVWIDGTGNAPRENAVIVIRGRHIDFVGDAAQWNPEEHEHLTTLDLRGRFVLPGLIDCHVHLAMDSPPDSRLTGEWAWTTLLMLKHAQNSLAAGITTVRDVGGRHGLEFSVRRSIEQGGSGINEKDMVDCEGQFQMNKRSLQW